MYEQNQSITEGQAHEIYRYLPTALGKQMIWSQR